MKDVLKMITQHSQTQPDYVAVQHQDETLTYLELENYSSRLAAQLLESKNPVIVYGHMSPFMVVGMIAALKAGCGYVPIDQSIPTNRIQHIFDKVSPQFVINTTDTPLNFEGVHEYVIQDIRAFEAVQSLPLMKSDAIAYTIFTSGSTGLPKGVKIYYESLVEFANWVDLLNQYHTKDIWLNQAPFSFDLSVMAIYPCLLSGGTLLLVNKEMIAAPKKLYELFQSEKINVWVSTPSFMEICLMLPNMNEKDMAYLRTFLFCGEVLGHHTAQSLLNKFPQSYLYNTYGPTEATVAITSVRVTQSVLDRHQAVPVGLPRSGTTLDLTEEGELIIKGSSVSAGYLKDPEKTEKAFFSDGGQRAYYSGDKATFEDGLWFVKGRIDNQIKYNGYRMELEEIEAKMNALSYVSTSMVVPIYKKDKIVYLKGVIKLNAENVDIADISKDVKQHLKSELPDYMIPKKIEVAEDMPLTNNGKLDRKRINEVYQS
ncbi:D-alanine--poly(phosphoribitol) ligase subunit DltA [Staphylococcus lutrae]|uniref:D-alanine--poly(Phosphoribitol) ligase subunit 1 n=1 Tax=Staphylococcus lutrae TaxID=155085 RepID=A0AAC9RV84_9STAP|nr:D-alanine--poly(phosphoribitol) ligase subunit DltA [Staphylococcus lutrae]ARJ51462.1 D-alanine--poly(phosphoribitol) ligase subunit 1 [Staphylococcus lutrae]PNZ37986.1 D-alanine--poly(phosphoribitol) ligase subunit 1 [Staphylococcus lutrae]